MASLNEESSDSGYSAAVQTTLFIFLLLAAVVGNGLFIFLFIRHKTLRTVHHALFFDLAVIDLLNSVINTPLSICYLVYDIPNCRGKTFAWIVSFLHLFLSLLSLSFLALQMVDRYLAVCWPFFYKVNKSMVKMIAIILIKWLVILTIVLFTYIPLYEIDIGNAPVVDYRELYAKGSGQKLSRYVAPVFVFVILVFGGLSLWKLRKRRGPVADVAQNAHNSLSTKMRKKAIYTILILLMVTLISYLPAVIKGRIWLGLENQAKIWLVFAIMFTLSVPSAVNPFIVLIRVKLISDKLKALIYGVKSIYCKNETDIENVEETKRENFPPTILGPRRIPCDQASVISRSISCPDIAIKPEIIKERRKSF